MVNIVVSQTGDVTGDKGKIIAYEGQEFSEVINIVHPLFPSATYYIEYKYKNTIFRNEIDTNNQVSIKVNDAGYVKCQFVAIDISTGDIVFKSNYWNLIVKESLKIEVSHYPCNALGHYYKHRDSSIIACSEFHLNNCNKNNNEKFNAEESYTKLCNELSNEEDIRFNEMQSLRQELAEIKAYINMDDPIASTLNANNIIIPGKYSANILSSGFPKENTEFKLVVSFYGDTDNILQNAYEKNTNNVYYRSAISANNVEPDWTDWILLNLQS